MLEEFTPTTAEPFGDCTPLQGLDPRELLSRGLESAPVSPAGTTWEPPAVAEISRLLPQYEVECLLGYGGMGAVYKALHPALDRSVALKLLPMEIAADELFVGRFQREARMLAKLHHPGIVAIYDFGQTLEGHLYFVMEYVDGTDLRRVMQAPGLEPDQALGLVAEICEALQFAHSKGVIHRDIKPANILITRDGRAKLADFGLSRPVDEEAGQFTSASMIIGTSDYMAPEQRDGCADHRADIFSLGIMLYEMLTGTRPSGAFAPPSSKARVDARLDEVVFKALQEEPAHRYQQAGEMKTAVDHIRATPLPATTVPRPRRTGPWVALAAIVASFAILAVGAFLFSEKHRNLPSQAPAPELAEASVAPSGNTLSQPHPDGPQHTEAPAAPKPSPAARKSEPATASAPAESFPDGFTPLLDRLHTDGWAQSGGGGVNVEDGVATTWMPYVNGTPYGVFWYTRKAFADFTLKAEFKVDSLPAKSGIYLRIPNPGQDPSTADRLGYEVQIWDDQRNPDSTGAIAGFQGPTENVLRIGAWNEFEITVVGQKYCVVLNDRLIKVITGIRNLSGYIGLQNHRDGIVHFRNIRIKELLSDSAQERFAETKPSVGVQPASPATPVVATQPAVKSPVSTGQASSQPVGTSAVGAGSESGFLDLFDRNERFHWRQCGPGGLSFADEVAATWTPQSDRSVQGLYWYAAREYGDFVLKAQFKMDSLTSNSGIFVRFAAPDNTPPDHHNKNGYEIQIWGNHADSESTGAIYDVQGPTSVPLIIGDWNEMEVSAIGQHYEVKLNDRLVNSYYGDRAIHGYVGLQNHNGDGAVYFKNVRIKDLSKQVSVDRNPATLSTPVNLKVDSGLANLSASFAPSRQTGAIRTDLEFTQSPAPVPAGTRALTPESEPITLRDALLKYKWQWAPGNSSPTPDTVLRFLEDGSAKTAVGETWRWTQTGPNQLTLVVAGKKQTFLTEAPFATLKHLVNGTLTVVASRMELVEQPAKIAHGLPAPATSEQPPPLATAALPPSPADTHQATAAGGGELEVFAKALPQAVNWISAPLNVAMPDNIHGLVRSMAEELQRESARTPQASPKAYALAGQICNSLTGALAEREQLLEQNGRTAKGRLTDAWLNQWSTRAAVIKSSIVGVYGQLRTAVAQSPAPSNPPQYVVTVDFPPIPGPVQAPPSQPYFGPGNPNPLDRGAYDRHGVWSGWWWWR